MAAASITNAPQRANPINPSLLPRTPAQPP
jgi:hypothetical protein